MGSWIWAPIIPKLEAADFECSALTLSGLHSDGDAERIQLETHVREVVEHVENLGCERVSLIGHSYSGILATIAAAELGDRVNSLVMVEAFFPEADKSPLESFGLDAEQEKSLINENSGRWPHPTRAELLDSPHLEEEAVYWLLERFIDHPGKTVSEPVNFDGDLRSLNVLFIANEFPSKYESLLESPKWKHVRIDAGHWPMLADPDSLASIMADNIHELDGEQGVADQHPARGESKAP